jgi:hypothetical protein
MFVYFFGGKKFTSCCPRKKKGGGGDGDFYHLSRGQVAPSTTGVDKIWQTCKGRPRVIVVCPKPSPPLLSKEGRRAEAKEGRKERTNERTNEGRDPHACEKTRPDAVAAPSSRRRRSELELRIPSRCRRGVFGLSVSLSLSLCLSSALPTTTFAYFHYRPTTFGLLPLWERGGLESFSFVCFFLSFFESLCVKRLCAST